MTIRAQTRVVNQPKPGPAWPLERARLINRHQRLSSEAEARRRREVAEARSHGKAEAKDEFSSWALADGEFRKYFIRSAADQIGREAGRYVEDWLRREIDPTLAVRKKYADTMLSAAMISADIRSIHENPQEQLMVTRVEFPPQRFHYAADVGPRAF